uniref:Putative secreted protein n=1 Tax=Ixodes ricinus TaxID=34613 RepID=A0A6B0UMR0_IXORI
MAIRLWLDICVLFVVSKYFHSRQFASGHVRLMVQWAMRKEQIFCAWRRRLMEKSGCCLVTVETDAFLEEYISLRETLMALAWTGFAYLKRPDAPQPPSIFFFFLLELGGATGAFYRRL